MAWGKLTSKTLTSAVDNVTTDTFTAKKFIQGITHLLYSSVTNVTMIFNNDTGANYSSRTNENGGTDGTLINFNDMRLNRNGVSDKDNFSVYYGINISSQEKLIIGFTVSPLSTGASNAPHRWEVVLKWANTSSQITSSKLGNDTAISYAIDSNYMILGTD